MADRVVRLILTEIKPDSADYKNRLTLSGSPISVAVDVPEPMLEGDSLTPQGLAYVMTEIDLALQRGYALRKAEYDDIISGAYVKKSKK